MSIFDTRRDRLRSLMVERFNNRQSELARAIDRPDNLISRILSSGPHRKTIGEKLARQIETALRLAPYELDGIPATRTAPAVATVYSGPITSEEADIGREWGKLEEPQRTTIATTIHLWVAAQKRGELPATRPRAVSKRPRAEPRAQVE